MLLAQEGQDDIEQPTWQQVEQALTAMHPRTRSFVTLSGEAGYVQTAGAKHRLTIEHRVDAHPGFRHYVLGASEPSADDVGIDYSGGVITVRRSEALASEDALSVFRRFYESGDVPKGYHLRDVSAMFES